MILKGKEVDKYLTRLIKELGWNLALMKLQDDINAGLIDTSGYTERIVEDNDTDDWEEQVGVGIPEGTKESYFIYVKDNQGNKDTLIVDDCDFSRVFEYDWWVKRDENGHKMAVTNINGKFISMQQFILGIPAAGKIIRFIDGNHLNFKRSNMKIFQESKIKRTILKNKFGYTFD